MVLISIHPFAFRKVFLVLVALLCFSALCLADPVLIVHRHSPTPEQFAKVKRATPTVLETLRPQDASAPAPGFGPVGSIDAQWNQTELRFTEPGKISLMPALPSSAFLKAMCELRSTTFPASPNLPSRMKINSF
jgi:hypothetical protein